MKKKNFNFEYYLEWVFKIGLLLYALLSFNSLCYGKSIISIILWPIVLCGAVLLVMRVRDWKEWISIPSVILLGLFIVSYLISMVVNLQYGYKDGIIKLAFLMFYFFILYTKKKDTPLEFAKKEIHVLGSVLTVYMFVCVLISFALMCIGYTKVETVENGWDIGIGFLWGRLWGIFTEPNYASILASIVMILSFYFLKLNVSRKVKVFLIINDVLQLFYIAFTDSRTGRVALGVGLAIFAFNLLNYERLCGQKKKIKLYVIILVPILSFVVGGMAPKWITTAYNECRKFVNEKTHSGNKGFVDRGYDLSEDVTNRRFDIWVSGLEVLSTTPIVGTSYTNILPYTLENCPDTYLTNNSAEKNFSSIHNEVLNILVGQGIVGLVVFLAFFFWVVYHYIKYFFQPTNEPVFYNVLISCMAIATAGAMFLTGMFYSNSPAAIMFWICLGDFMLRVEKRRGTRKKEKIEEKN